MTDYTLEAESGSFHITPEGFYHYAVSFLNHAQIDNREKRFSPVPYYLICHALELGLKAYLLSKNYQIEKLKKKLGHDLEKCFKKANEKFLENIFKTKNDEGEALQKANKYYSGKGFEYFDVITAASGGKDLPEIGVLKEMASRLLMEIKKSVIPGNKAN